SHMQDISSLAPICLCMPNPPPIIIAGCGAVTAAGIGIDRLRAALQANITALRPSEKFLGPRFQSNVVGAAPPLNNGEDHDDPAWSLASEALCQARREASEHLRDLDAKRIALVLSTTKANIEALERIMAGRPCSDRARRHLQGDLLAADLALDHGARGPGQCVSLACVSGLIALQQGARLMQRGAADAALVVGVDHLSAFVMAGFSSLKALDPRGCRPFD